MGDHSGDWVDSLTDSKKLTAKKRTELSPLILGEAAATGLGWVSSQELDRYGLSNSLKLATRRAVKQVLAKKVPFDEIIIDGTINFLRDTPLADRVTILKKADLLIKEVSAASIIAKVARDNYMIKLAEKYPEYGFEKHVGYGTAAHKSALEQYGVCPEHRHSFRPIREFVEQGRQLIHERADPIYQETYEQGINNTNNSTTSRGQHGEQVVIDYLKAQNHTIIAHNYKTKSYEIDIISTYKDKIYFTEVKYRKSQTHGSSLAQITTKKRQQMHFAAEAFLADHPEFNKYQPILAAASVYGVDFTFEAWLPLDI